MAHAISSTAASRGNIAHASQQQRPLRALSNAQSVSVVRSAAPSRGSSSRQCRQSGLVRSASRKGRPAVTGVRASAAAEADARAGVSQYKPKSYDELVADAARTLQSALDDGLTRIEIDFPPLPSSVAGYTGSSDEFIDANIQLGLALIKKLNARNGMKGKLVLADAPEKRRASRRFKAAFDLATDVSLGTLDEDPNAAAAAADGSLPSSSITNSRSGGGFFGALQNLLDLDFNAEETGPWMDPCLSDIHVITNASCTELTAVKRYVEKLPPTTPVVLFNLELDTLRADLGLLGFPPKDMHYGFLTQFLPAFYLRQRDYSKSVAVAPFILNYSGALLRIYPGPWQVMLKQGDGSYACVAEGAARFQLGEVKQELQQSLGLQEEEGSTMDFLRKGYKTSTWWEEDQQAEKSTKWRT